MILRKKYLDYNWQCLETILVGSQGTLCGTEDSNGVCRMQNKFSYDFLFADKNTANFLSCAAIMVSLSFLKDVITDHCIFIDISINI